MKNLPSNRTLRYSYANDILPTVRNYIQLDTMADASTLEQLRPDTRGEIEKLTEAGLLVAQPVDATPSTQLIRQYFPLENRSVQLYSIRTRQSSVRPLRTVARSESVQMA